MTEVVSYCTASLLLDNVVDVMHKTFGICNKRRLNDFIATHSLAKKPG